MQGLTRLRVGHFKIEEALTLPQMEEICRLENWQTYLYPIDYVLMEFPALVVNQEQQCSLIHGAPIASDTENKEVTALIRDKGFSRVYTEDGSFLGMVKYEAENHCWHPEKIFWRKCCE
jgi:tRNA pseudouridine55 synthase